MATILLVEDDSTFSQLLTGFLKKHDHHVEAKNNVNQGIAALAKNSFDLLLLDYRLPDGNGLDVLRAAWEKDSPPAAIMMTSFNDVRTAVKAIRMGAFDYITKPVNPEELLLVIGEALKKGTAAQPAPEAAFDFIRGASPLSKRLYQYLELVAPTDIAVILEGESGTGKEYAARTIHNLSQRADKPFVAVDCGALSKELASSELFGHVKGAFTGALQDKKGQFVAASSGTLFLDEVGNLSYEVQVKLLRALQEKIVQPVGGNKPVKTDVRIIAATNDDLQTSVKEGKFREDLYHRLNEFKIDVPSLKERGTGDLRLFTDHFIGQAAAELGKHVTGLSDQVREIFERYDWPGNLRELRNVTRRMVLLSTGELAGRETLPEEMTIQLETAPAPQGTDLKSLKEANEKEHILKVLEETRYNKSMAAKILNIDRTTLYNKMSKYGISL